MLFSELNLLDGGKVLHVDAGRELVIVPVDLSENRLATKLNESRNLASGKGNVTSILPGALKKLLAIADRISDLDRLRPLCPFCHVRLSSLHEAGVALEEIVVNRLRTRQALPDASRQVLVHRARRRGDGSRRHRASLAQ